MELLKNRAVTPTPTCMWKSLLQASNASPEEVQPSQSSRSHHQHTTRRRLENRCSENTMLPSANVRSPADIGVGSKPNGAVLAIISPESSRTAVLSRVVSCGFFRREAESVESDCFQMISPTPSCAELVHSPLLLSQKKPEHMEQDTFAGGNPEHLNSSLPASCRGLTSAIWFSLSQEGGMDGHISSRFVATLDQRNKTEQMNI